MPLSQNSQLLVQTLEATPLLDGRFQNLKLVNFDALNDIKKGCFSLVFSAYDAVENATVALKFYDIDPALFYDPYRRNAFLREHEILQLLQSKERCLQLAAPMAVYDFSLPTPSGVAATFPCQYFGIQWLDQEIESFFYRQQDCDTLDKLRLFNEILLAVEALHRHEVFHRDLKPDNLRACEVLQKRIVVAIDLGTAARFSSGYIQQHYTVPVGAIGYAAPEAICGLAAHRYLAPYTDIYALGCLLFELFNPGLFFHELVSRNPKYQAILLGLSSYVQGVTTEPHQLLEWKKGIARFAAGVNLVDIEATGSSVPPGIVPLLNDLLHALTHTNFANRPRNLEWVRSRVWSAIRCLENQKLYARALMARRERRRLVEEKLRKKAERLQTVLATAKNAIK